MTKLKTPGLLGPSAERLSNEIRVFAWHECITTLMVSFPRIRDILVRGCTECFGADSVSAVELITGVGVGFCEEYVGDVIGEDASNLFWRASGKSGRT